MHPNAPKMHPNAPKMHPNAPKNVPKMCPKYYHHYLMHPHGSGGGSGCSPQLLTASACFATACVLLYFAGSDNFVGFRSSWVKCSEACLKCGFSFEVFPAAPGCLILSPHPPHSPRSPLNLHPPTPHPPHSPRSPLNRPAPTPHPPHSSRSPLDRPPHTPHPPHSQCSPSSPPHLTPQPHHSFRSRCKVYAYPA